MARYESTRLVRPVQDVIFSDPHAPGHHAPFGGIYKCTACESEIVCRKGKTLPTTHSHEAEHQTVRWQLLVEANELENYD
jgi:hypothetical protein